MGSRDLPDRMARHDVRADLPRTAAAPAGRPRPRTNPGWARPVPSSASPSSKITARNDWPSNGSSAPQASSKRPREHRERLVQFATHPQPLGPLTGEHQRQPTLGSDRATGDGLPRQGLPAGPAFPGDRPAAARPFA